MKNITLSEEESDHLYYSIYARIGFIETGTLSRAEDLVKKDPKYRPRILSKEQREVIILLENLATKLLNS